MQGGMPNRTRRQSMPVSTCVKSGWTCMSIRPARALRVSNDRVGLKRLKRVLSALPVARVVMGGDRRASPRRTALAACGGLGGGGGQPAARPAVRRGGRQARQDRRDRRPGCWRSWARRSNRPRRHRRRRRWRRCESWSMRAPPPRPRRRSLANRLAAAGTAFLKAELRRRRDALASAMSNGSTPRSNGASWPIPTWPAAMPILLDPGRRTGHGSHLPHRPGRARRLLGQAGRLTRQRGARRRRQRRPQRPRSAASGACRVLAVRNAAYIAALSASRHNPDLAAFAKRLGKPASARSSSSPSCRPRRPRQHAHHAKPPLEPNRPLTTNTDAHPARPPADPPTPAGGEGRAAATLPSPRRRPRAFVIPWRSRSEAKAKTMGSMPERRGRARRRAKGGSAVRRHGAACRRSGPANGIEQPGPFRESREGQVATILSLFRRPNPASESGH